MNITAATTAPAPSSTIVEHQKHEVYRITRGAATKLSVTGPGTTFSSLEGARTYAEQISLGATHGAVAILAAGHGAFAVQPVLAATAAYLAPLPPEHPGDWKFGTPRAFHTEGKIPTWSTTGHGPQGWYGNETTTATGDLLGIVDGATAFHVAAGEVHAGLLTPRG